MHACHAHVCEAVLVVVVVVLPLCAIIGVAVVGIEVKLQPVAVEHVAQLCRGALLVLQVVHKIVVHLGAHEGRACLWGAGLVAHAKGQGVAMPQVEGGPHLEPSVQEARLSALAIAVVGTQAVAHVALAPHLLASQLCGQEIVRDALVAAVHRKGIEALQQDVIVVAETVAHAHRCIGVVEVVLHAGVAGGIGADGIGVHVVEVFAAQEVFHRLVVHALVGCQLQASGEAAFCRDVPVVGAAQIGSQMVVVFGLDVVFGVRLALVELAVGKIERVEINLACCLSRCPSVIAGPEGILVVVAAVGVAPHVVMVGGEVLPVVGGGVGAVVVEFGTAVHGIFEVGACGELHAGVDFEVPREQCAGLIVVHHAAAALLSVLIAPVGVVEAVVGQPVGLVGAGSLLGALRGVSPCGQVERVAVIENLLGRQEIGQRVVERAFHGGRVHVRPAVAHRTEEGPSVLGDSSAKAVHAAQGVVAVGARERELAACGMVACSHVVHRAPAHAGKGERIILEGVAVLHASHGIVHATDGGVVELSVLCVVHAHAVHVDVVVAAVVGTELEAHRAPQVAHVAGVDIVVGAHHDDILRHFIVFAQL